MTSDNTRELFTFVASQAADYRETAATKTPYAQADREELRAGLCGPLPELGRDGREVIQQLIENAGPGLVGTVSPAAFGWVMGGSHPVGVAADWLTSAWGQNAGIYQTTPASAIVEEAVSTWLLELLDLPATASVGLTTGATMAGFTCLAAARDSLLRQQGWDLNEDGLFGAPEVPVFVSEQAHSTIFAALRYLGFGRRALITVNADDDGRMNAGDLEKKLSSAAKPGLILAQAGHINSGAMDDFGRICTLARQKDAWVHVDGAFGLWVRASGREDRRSLCAHVDKADSWAVDGHKWLQVPYDCGYAIVRDEEAHQRAMSITASYLNRDESDGRVPSTYVPELSRRARGFASWAVLQTLGRRGVAELVDHACDAAASVAKHLSDLPDVEILHPVCLNQLALAFGGNDAMTKAVIDDLQNQGRWFVKGAQWKGRQILRISIISAPLSDAQIKELADDIAEAWRRVRLAA